MYRLTNRITIGEYQFNFVNEIEVDSSWENLTDTCTIKIPKKLLVENKPITEGNNAVFKVGDKVTVETGYDYQHDTIFVGYISNLKLTYPIEIKVEDGMWKFKQVSFKKTYSQVTVKELVGMMNAKLASPVKVVYSYGDMQLGKFRISNATGAQVFEELRKTYGIYSFFREGTLYVGFAYTHTEQNYRKVVPLEFNRQIIEDNLLYRSKDDVKIKVKGISIGPDNKQITVDVGDPDGIVYNYFRPNKTLGVLTQLATNFQKSIKVDGFSGSITTFGKPYIRQGDAVELRDPSIPERNGVYLVKKVARSFGQDGYRQEIELDTKVS